MSSTIPKSVVTIVNIAPTSVFSALLFTETGPMVKPITNGVE